MARGVGLDAGVFEVKVVELDGSYRRPRLTKVSIDRVASAASTAGDEGRAQMEAEAAIHALKDQKVARHGVNLGFPSREAVVRNLKIPFVGDDAIRKVIKFEAEGAIHSHNVDDMVVDFQTYERGDGETSVLVAAVPKKSLGPLLDALQEQGIEPERVDLDAMALFRAAEWAGCFGEDVAEAAAAASEDDELPVVPETMPTVEGRRARIVVDVGARSTRVLAVIRDRLVDLRALRIGIDAIAEELARKVGLTIDEARDAVRVGLESGQDVALEAVEAAVEAAVEDLENGNGDAMESQLPDRRPQIISHAEIVAARDGFLDRLQRELLRFLAGLPRVNDVERLFVTGSGSLVPGVTDRLGEIFSCAVQPLDVLTKLSHGLDEEEVEQIGPRIATAVGLALAMMGGRGGFNFRQEDLAYRRHFDRIKFPLAIACMLAVFLPFIYGIRQHNKLKEYGKAYGELFSVSEDGGQARRGAAGIRAVFWGYVGQLMNAQQPNNVIAHLGAKKFEDLTRKLVAQETFLRLPVIRSELEKHLKEQREQTGVYEDLQLPSGVYVLSYFSNVIKQVEDRLGEFLIAELDLNLQSRGPYLTFKAAFRGSDFRERFAILQEALSSTFSEETSPFMGFGRAGGEDVFQDPTVDGAYFQVKLDIKEDGFETRAAR